MLNVFTPSLALPSADPATLDTDVDLLTKSKNLSSTLHKVYLWEKKLLDEVKVCVSTLECYIVYLYFLEWIEY